MGVGQSDTANNTLCRYCFQVYPFLAKKAPSTPVFGHYLFFYGSTPQQGTPWSKHDTAGYLLIYSVKRTQLIGRRPLSPCRVRKTAGYTLPRLLFPRTVPRFSEMYPDLAGSGTLPSTIFSAQITFRSQQRTPKPKSSCAQQAMATSIASLGARSAPTKEHQSINSSSSEHTMPLFYSSVEGDCSGRESET